MTRPSERSDASTWAEEQAKKVLEESAIVHVINAIKPYMKEHKYHGWTADENAAHRIALDILTPVVARALLATRAAALAGQETTRLKLHSGVVGDYDGAYDWIKKEDWNRPEYAVGFHHAAWAEDCYTVVEVLESRAATHPGEPS